MKKILPLVDGLYYPGDRDELFKLINRLLESCAGEHPPKGLTPESTGKSAPEISLVRGIVTPHGAYTYSGQYMASAFLAVRELKPRRIIIIAPLHRESEPAVLVPPGDRFLTPLGEVLVDTQTRDELCSRFGFIIEETPFLEEPSVESQLPFIQVLFPETPVLPLFLSGERASIRKTLSKGLAGFLGDDTLCIVTSNLSGYLPLSRSQPPAEDFIRRLSLNSGESFHPGRYLNSLKQGDPRPCGLACLAAWWEAAEKAFSPEIRICSWGPDIPLQEDSRGTSREEKHAFYGGFTLTMGGL